MRSILLILSLFVYFTAHADNDKYKEKFNLGLAAVKVGDINKAMKYWLPLATQDYAEAQYRLGTLYRLGIGVPKDYGKAFQWFSRAATMSWRCLAM